MQLQRCKGNLMNERILKFTGNEAHNKDIISLGKVFTLGWLEGLLGKADEQIYSVHAHCSAISLFWVQ